MNRVAASCTLSTVRCPFCRENDDKVVDSRAGEDGAAIRRRRECLACGRRFTTYERIDEHGLVVRKRDGTQEPFDREKLRDGIERAASGRLDEHALEALSSEIAAWAISACVRVINWGVKAPATKRFSSTTKPVMEAVVVAMAVAATTRKVRNLDLSPVAQFDRPSLDLNMYHDCPRLFVTGSISIKGELS